jgi:hypothetical protein
LFNGSEWKFQNCSYFVINSYDQGNDGFVVWIEPLNLPGNAFRKDLVQGNDGFPDKASQFNLSAYSSIKD